MTHVDRNRVPRPATFALKKVSPAHEELKKATEFFSRTRGQQGLNYLAANHNTLKGLGASATQLDTNSAQIRAVRQEMKMMLDANAPYLAMLREWIRQVKQRGDCVLLEQFGIDVTRLINP